MHNNGLQTVRRLHAIDCCAKAILARAQPAATKHGTRGCMLIDKNLLESSRQQNPEPSVLKASELLERIPRRIGESTAAEQKGMNSPRYMHATANKTSKPTRLQQLRYHDSLARKTRAKSQHPRKPQMPFPATHSPRSRQQLSEAVHFAECPEHSNCASPWTLNMQHKQILHTDAQETKGPSNANTGQR